MMKTSNIKPNFSPERAASLPQLATDIVPGSLHQLTEGHFSQVFSYETHSREKRVVRLGRKLHSFEADKYAHDHFASSEIPVPEVLEIGEVEPGLYYCISEFVDGKPADQLPPEEFATAREAIEDSFAAIFKTDVSGTSGWGRIDRVTSNGKNSSYAVGMQKNKDELQKLKEQCEAHNVEPRLVDDFASNLQENLPRVTPERRLVHGDFGFDNVLVKDDEVAAVVDWSGVEYGDWIHDYSRLEFWYPGRHMPALEFAEKYHLDTQNFNQRWIAHMADNALTTLEYVFKYEDASTLQWVKDNLKNRLGALRGEGNT